MEKRSQTNGDATGVNPVRDARLARLLTSEAVPDVLPWSRAVALIEAAPPARRPWYAPLLHSAPQLRYVLGTLLALGLGTGVLAALPAQSDQVGTVLSLNLPAAWQVGSPEYADFKSGAGELFAGLAVPQGEMYFLNQNRSGSRPELAIVLLGVDRAAAAGLHEDLVQRYPALEPYAPDYMALNSHLTGSRLNELLLQLGAPPAGQLDEASARLLVLRELRQAGYDNIDIRVEHSADGGLVIEVDAAMPIAVQGHTQEDLSAAGFTEETLGPDGYQRLVEALAAQ